MRKIVMIIVGIMLFSNVVSANSIIVEPNAVNLDLIGGDNITKQITITWTGETAVVGFIGTAVASDGDGIFVTYSENPVILYPNVPKVLDMTISIAINIVPDTYLITTDVYTEIDEIVKYKITHETVYKTVYIENSTRVDELITNIQQLQEKINQTTNCTDLSLLLALLQDTFNELAITIEDVLDKEPEEVTEEHIWGLIPFILLVLINFILTIVVAVYLYRKFKVLELQTKDKGSRKNENKTK